jgi:hypothetical protein
MEHANETLDNKKCLMQFLILQKTMLAGSFSKEWERRFAKILLCNVPSSAIHGSWH